MLQGCRNPISTRSILVVEGSQTVCPTNCPRPRGNNDVEKDMCSQIQCPGVNCLVQSIKLNKKKIKIIKRKKRKTITTANEHCCAKPNQQCIDDTESNASASVGTEAHKWGVAATKTNGNEMVCDSPSSTNDAVSFDRIDVACQGRRLALQECPFGETGTNMFCWFVFDCLLNVLIKIFDTFKLTPFEFQLFNTCTNHCFGVFLLHSFFFNRTSILMEIP
jgi:hypothetical protein